MSWASAFEAGALCCSGTLCLARKPEFANLVIIDKHKCILCKKPVHVPCCSMNLDDNAICWTCEPPLDGGRKPAAKIAAADEAEPVKRAVKPKGAVTKNSAKIAVKRGTTGKIAAVKKGGGKAAARGVVVEKRVEKVVEVESVGGVCVYTNCKAKVGDALFLCARGSKCSKNKSYKGGPSIHAWCSMEIMTGGKVEEKYWPEDPDTHHCSKRCFNSYKKDFDEKEKVTTRRTRTTWAVDGLPTLMT
jgi:hypothetical protein